MYILPRASVINAQTVAIFCNAIAFAVSSEDSFTVIAIADTRLFSFPRMTVGKTVTPNSCSFTVSAMRRNGGNSI